MFNFKLKPGVYHNSKINNLLKYDETIRFLPQVEYNFGLKKFLNLSEYNITPTNITEQF